jgi:alkaline phosphatase D
LINPTPIVGPDRGGKGDNHANKAFLSEGREFRQWFSSLGYNFMVIAGDRHWQYHSVDPETGLEEFGCGPASDLHAGGSPGFEPDYHRFHRVAGGFLSATVEPATRGSRVAIRLHDVDGKVVHEQVRTQTGE